MKKFSKIMISLLCIISLSVGLTATVYAHSGRTDSSGGHRDNRNVSGLGSYHYHCGGYPAHLHVSGYCPYRDIFPSGVSLNADKSVLEIGEEASISASVFPSNACNTNISWKSSDSNIVRVKNGKIIAVGFGAATITASTFNDKTCSIEITVKEVVADSISITGFKKAENGDENILYIGDTYTLGAKIMPENVDNPTVTWSSSNPEIVSVENGRINALRAGTATITATSSNAKTDTLILTIKEVVAEKIEINIPDVIIIGDNINLSVQYYPSNTSDKDIEWKTSNSEVATIDKNGNLKAINVGTVSITATQKDVESTLVIDIQPIDVESIELSAPSEFQGQFGKGDSVQLTATVYPENATYQDITWSSSNPFIVNVDESGLIYAVSSGTAVITALSSEGVKSTVQIRVTSLFTPFVLVGVIILVIAGTALITLNIVKQKHGDKTSEAHVNETEKKEETKKRLILVLIAIVTIVAIIIISIFFCLSRKYERAMFLAHCSRFEDAAILFEELGSFKDSKDQLANLLEQHPNLSIQFAQMDDEISYGAYERDGVLDNSTESLE